MISDANVSLIGDITKRIREKFNEIVIFMEKSVLKRVQSFVEGTGETKNSLANRCGMAPQTFWRYVNGDNKITVSLLESLLEVFPDLSAEWLLRGEGEKYKTDVPREGDSEEMEDLRIELTKVHAERDELKQICEQLKAEAREWRESNEYHRIIEQLKVEAAELRARLDEQRNTTRILAEAIGRQPQQPVITGTIPRIKIPRAVVAESAANMAAGVPVALAIGDATNLPGAIAAKAPKTKKNIG